MSVHSLITDMREKANSQNPKDQFAALLFALQIPSICSRIEIPKTDKNMGTNQNDPQILYKEKTGKPFDKNLYHAWLWLHRESFIPWCYSLMPFNELCDAIYQLRNDVTHAGSLLEVDSEIVLTENYSTPLFSGKRLFLPIQMFCGTMFDAARYVFSVDGTFYFGSSMADEKLTLHVLPNVDFNDIRNYLYLKYHEFWANRHDDLILYQTYCFSDFGSLDTIEKKLNSDPTWKIGDLTRTESERLIKIVHECNDFGEKLDEEITKRHFIRKGVFCDPN